MLTRRRSGLVWLIVLASWIGGLALGPVREVAAHSDHDQALFVADDGVDQDNCYDVKAPCRTIDYAITRAGGKGTSIRVAAGEYFFNGNEMYRLLSRQIPITGGYSRDNFFAIQDPKANPTFIKGVPAAYREDLALRGFGRVEDRDNLEDPADVHPGAPHVEKPAVTQGIITGPVACSNGQAVVGNITYACNGIDFMSRIPLADFKTATYPNGATDASNLWGHIDLNTGREYALIGVNVGTGVVDVTDPAHPVIVGTVPGNNNMWREVKVYQFYNQQQQKWNAYAYLSTESSSQGLQIIDLNNLPTSVSLATTYTGDFTSSHTVYVHNVSFQDNTPLPGKTPTLYMNGTKKTGLPLNKGAFRIFNIDNPTAPKLLQQPSSASYTHDSTSFTITDGRTSQCHNGHNPCEILVDYSENAVDIWDVTELPPVKLGSVSYSGYGYIHSGWWTDDKMHVFIQDEYDEVELGHNSKLRTIDLSNLRQPVISGTWTSQTAAIDHNGYIIDDTYYMSHYQRGVTLLDVSRPNDVQETAFFDTFPQANEAEFNGAWGVYPYLPSGTILVSDIEGGLYAFRQSNYDGGQQPIIGLAIDTAGSDLVNQTTLLTASIDLGGPVTYSWDFGDGSQAMTGEHVSHVYDTEGTYTVKLTATNAYHSLTITRKVTINADTNAIQGLTIHSSSPDLVNETTLLSATILAGGPAIYTWDFGDGSQTMVGESVAHSYLNAGTYTVTVTADNGTRTATTTQSVEITAPQRWWIYIPQLASDQMQRLKK